MTCRDCPPDKSVKRPFQKACQFCGEVIWWFRNARTGSWYPLDLEPSSAGTVVIEAGGARALPMAEAAAYTGEKFVFHFKTCPRTTGGP